MMKINIEESYYQQQTLVNALGSIGELQLVALKLAKAQDPDLPKIRQVNQAIKLFSEAIEQITKGKSGQKKIQAGTRLIEKLVSVSSS